MLLCRIVGDLDLRVSQQSRTKISQNFWGPTFVKEQDRGPGRGQGIWYTVKDVNGTELVGRVSQVVEV